MIRAKWKRLKPKGETGIKKHSTKIHACVQDSMQMSVFLARCVFAHVSVQECMCTRVGLRMCLCLCAACKSDISMFILTVQCIYFCLTEICIVSEESHTRSALY